MSTLTPNYNLIKPGVNDPTDQDLWGGYLNTDMDIIDTTMKSISDSVQGLYPVGSLYFNASVATNPSALLGFGTWTAYGAGRVLIGVGTGTDINGVMETFALDDTGGEYEHILLINEIPEHDHADGDFRQFVGGASGGTTLNYQSGGNNNRSSPALANGGDDAHNNIQPYIAVHIWERTA